MQEKYEITDAELEIMKVLWKNGEAGLTEIVLELDKIKKRNKNKRNMKNYENRKERLVVWQKNR